MIRAPPGGATNLYPMIRGVLFDLDGVLYNGEAPIPGAAGAVERVRRQGVAARFLTNTTSRPRSAIVAKLAKLGIAAAPEEILTPPVAAAAWIRSRADGSAALFVPPATRAEFAGLEAEGADSTVRYVVPETKPPKIRSPLAKRADW